MLAIPNPQPVRPPLPLLDNASSFLIGSAIVGAVLVIVLIALAGIGVLRRFGISAQRSVVLIGALGLVTIVVGLLGVFLRG